MSEELLQMAETLEKLVTLSRQEQINHPLERVKQAADNIGKAWSGSWLGYHANVYYQDYQSPPPGAHFNIAWGLKVPLADLGSTGDWVENTAEAVEYAIYRRANAQVWNLSALSLAKPTRSSAKQQRTLLSIIELEIGDSNSPFLTALREEAGNLTVISKNQFIERAKPSYNMTVYDEVAGHQGMRVPAHLAVLSEVYAIQHTINIVESLLEVTRQVESHVTRQQRRQQQVSSVGTKVFIGHGRSLIWWQLKDFIEKLGLPVDEFNSVQTAGISTSDRLMEMLSSAAIAFLVMTGEDEQPTGELRPRENVVHEAGMFQGRLGFKRAIVLLEEGCEKFSNNAGLTHVPFPKGNIRATFQDLREVLEREDILKPGASG